MVMYFENKLLLWKPHPKISSVWVIHNFSPSKHIISQRKNVPCKALFVTQYQKHSINPPIFMSCTLSLIIFCLPLRYPANRICYLSSEFFQGLRMLVLTHRVVMVNQYIFETHNMALVMQIVCLEWKFN